LFYVLPFGFDFGEQSVKEWDPKLDSRRRNYRDALSKFFAPGLTITETPASSGLMTLSRWRMSGLNRSRDGLSD
jgi:hypothetical protein